MFNFTSKRQIKEASQETQEELYDTSFQDTLVDIKILKLLPFPTQTFVLNYGSGLSVFGMPAELINRNIFTSLALTVSRLNRIYMPTLSLRFEMQLDLKMIVGRSYDDRKLYLDNISKDFNIENKILSYAMGFFESKDIDLGIVLSNSQSFSEKRQRDASRHLDAHELTRML